MSRSPYWSILDAASTSVEPVLICTHKHLCSQKDCKRADYSSMNSISYVPLPDGWRNCEYFVGGHKR
jgi:hypothetical protein